VGFLLLPLVYLFAVSFAERSPYGTIRWVLSLGNYIRAFQPLYLEIYGRSLWMAGLTTVATALLAYPVAYTIALVASPRWRSALLLLVIIPFWTSFLIRTYAWLTILGPEGLAGFIGGLFGDDSWRILGTEWAVQLGLVYGYLPLMVFPLYVTLERMDRSLVEASKDLGAGRWATFRQITFPIALPGVITGSILVFIPMIGEYVIPNILGYGRVFTVGSALVLRFLEARDWPVGSAQAVVLVAIMLVSVTFYVWFINRGRRSRDVSML